MQRNKLLRKASEGSRLAIERYGPALDRLSDYDKKICIRCVMDFSDPDIIFDKHGICNYCHAAAKAANGHRIDKTQLPWIIDYIKKRGRGKKYDVLLGLSGGVDSSTALRVIREHGLRPLTFSCDNLYNDPIADENIMNLVEGLKVPFYRYSINFSRFRELQEAFIKAGVKNVEICTDHIIYATAYEMASKYKIPTIISGGNWQGESIMPAAWGYSARDLRHIKSIYRKFTGKKLTGVPTLSMLKYLWYRNVKRIKVINLLDYCDYNPLKERERLAKLFQWKNYGAKHEESKFTKWFQNVYLPEKFGIDKRKPHLSSLIHSGCTTRQQALVELAKPLEKVEMRFDFDWRSIPAKEHEEYPMNEHWWKAWGKFFKVLNKLGYEA